MFTLNKSMLIKPQRLSHPLNWAGHIPFIAWLIEELRPGIIVELGTHSGNSYFAMCQAVQLNGLDTKCYAVDTWLGDKHAGDYPEDVFQDVFAYNQSKYSHFSSLLQMTFDEALNYFSDETIDLLHIDGMHTYEAVKHDFQNWLPKLSARGVAILHDIGVRERGFGVWKLWEELSAQYPAYSFNHSHGLGVLFIGDEARALLTDKFLKENSDLLNNMFAHLGAFNDTEATLNNKLREELTKLKFTLRSREDELSQVKENLATEEAKHQEESERLREAQSALTRAEKTIETYANAEFWRMTKPLRVICDLIKILFRGKQISAKSITQQTYAKWIALYDTLDDEKRQDIKNKIKKMEEDSPLPLISVVMPTYNTPPDVLREALDSVKRQLYPRWELCIADDASTQPHVREILNEYAKGDARIKVHYRQTNGHISEASNSALALATGEFVALLDHDDVIPENAIYEVALAIQENPSASLFYTDEDKLDFNGIRCAPYFKPDWNPDLILGQNFFCHLGVYRRSLLNELGGFRKGFEGAQDYDLMLRCVDVVGHKAVCHIPKVLYHWRILPGSAAHNAESKPYAFQAAVKALEESLRRNKIDAKVTEIMPLIGLYKITYALPATPPKVSIIIPTRDKAELLEKCITSIQTKTTYPDYELIVVDNGSVEATTAEYLQTLARKPNVTILRDDEEFNYSRLNNKAARMAKGEILCLLNNDIEVITPDWLTEMVSHAVRPEIGAVGAKLYYPDDTVQHAGVILGVGGVAGHAHHGLRRENAGYFSRAWLTQNYSAVTGACLVIRKSVYEEVGGLNEQDLTVAFNDVDFCIRARDAGYRNLWTPFAELYHHESASRGYDTTSEKQVRARKEIEYMKKTHGEKLTNDPAYNPNLSLDLAFSFCLDFLPRLSAKSIDTEEGLVSQEKLVVPEKVALEDVRGELPSYQYAWKTLLHVKQEEELKFQSAQTALTNELNKARHELNEARHGLNELIVALLSAEDTINAYANATFWRITKPLRFICDVAKTFFRRKPKSNENTLLRKSYIKSLEITNPSFSTYLEACPVVSEPTSFPVTPEDIELVKESGLFSSEWYLQEYPDLTDGENERSSVWAIEHYLRYGWLEDRSPGPLFPIKQYTAAYPDLRSISYSPLLHYVRFGKRKGRVLPSGFPIASPVDLAESLFQRQQNEFTDKDLKQQIDAFDVKPLISIVMPLYSAPLTAFKAAIESIRKQIYENFELIVVDDGSDDERPCIYLEELAKNDPRILHTAQKGNRGISAATNEGLKLASGQYIAFMDQDDALTPDALFWVANEINQYPLTDFIYTDEAKITPNGEFIDFLIKPDWSPERLMVCMYIGHLNVVKTSLARKVCFDSVYDTAQDLDFALKCTEQAICIRHIERILYLWRALETSVASGKTDGRKKYIRDIGLQANLAAFKRRGIDAELSKMPDNNRVQVRTKRSHCVSIIVSVNRYEDTGEMIDSILKQTTYAHFELVIVSNVLTHNKIREEYRYRDDFVFLEYSGAPNLSDQYNIGVAESKGDILVFMSPGITVQNEAWLQFLMEYLSLPDIGGVCGKIIDTKRGGVHSAGYYAGGYGYFTPRLAGYPNWVNADNYYGSLENFIQNISVLSKELFAVSRVAYEAVGGFDSVNTPNLYSVADLSLRLLEQGYRNVYTPYSKALYRQILETASLFSAPEAREELYILGRWHKYLTRDLYYTPSLRTALETDPMNQFKMFIPKTKNLAQKKDAILLVTHELSRTGAPMAILYMAQAILRMGSNPIVVSPKDGELRIEFERLSIPLIVDTTLSNEAYSFIDHSPFLRLAKCCRLTVVNVALSFKIVKGLHRAAIPYVWWIHEGEYVIREACHDPMFIDVLKNVNGLHLGSLYIKKFITAVCPDIKTRVLHYGTEDLNLPRKVFLNEKTRFIVVGTFDRRKAQDVVIDAFFNLNEKMRNEIEIHMIGGICDKDFYERLCARVKKIAQFVLHDVLPHNELISMINNSDVLLCPSRDDPMPIVVTYGFMCSKICIVSDHTGSALLIENEKSGFVVPVDDAKALAKCMEYIVEHKNTLSGIGARARKIFEEYFTMDVFEENLSMLLEEYGV